MDIAYKDLTPAELKAVKDRLRRARVSMLATSLYSSP
jgi:hypothetical protein